MKPKKPEFFVPRKLARGIDSRGLWCNFRELGSFSDACLEVLCDEFRARVMRRAKQQRREAAKRKGRAS